MVSGIYPMTSTYSQNRSFRGEPEVMLLDDGQIVAVVVGSTTGPFVVACILEDAWKVYRTSTRENVAIAYIVSAIFAAVSFVALAVFLGIDSPPMPAFAVVYCLCDRHHPVLECNHSRE